VMDHHGDAAAYRELRHRQAGRDDDAQVAAEDDGARLGGAQPARLPFGLRGASVSPIPPLLRTACSSAQHTRWQSSHRGIRIHPSLLA
jgi:hypothetical protein